LKISKKQKLYNLRQNISVESQRIKYLLEKDVLTEIALEKSEKISRMSEKIGKILKH